MTEFPGYLRVTEVLKPFSGLDGIDPAVVSNAGRRGTKVHRICEGILSGLGEFDIDEESWGYVQSFKLWLEKTPEFKLLELERRFYCQELLITGQIDIICDLPGGTAIVDLKTSSKPSKTWPLQGAAYYYLATKAGLDIKQVLFVHLNKHGKAPKVHKYVPDVELFQAVLKVFKYFFMEK